MFDAICSTLIDVALGPDGLRQCVWHLSKRFLVCRLSGNYLGTTVHGHDWKLCSFDCCSSNSFLSPSKFGAINAHLKTYWYVYAMNEQCTTALIHSDIDDILDIGNSYYRSLYTTHHRKCSKTFMKPFPCYWWSGKNMDEDTYCDYGRTFLWHIVYQLPG